MTYYVDDVLHIDPRFLRLAVMLQSYTKCANPRVFVNRINYGVVA